MTPRRRRGRWMPPAAATLALALTACAGGSETRGDPDGVERVERVIDGDTVELSESGRARLIGVDTPEVHGGSECFGRQASAYAERTLEGREVPIERGVEERDRYGRLLVYLYLDGEMFNERLVREGYATPLTVPPNVRHADELAASAREARESAVGLWGACAR